MTWFKGHPRATLLIATALQATIVALSAVVLSLRWEMLLVVTLVPYAGMALVNGWVLKLKGRSRHWLWLYVFYSWGGALIPVCIALFAKPSQQPVDNQVRPLGA